MTATDPTVRELLVAARDLLERPPAAGETTDSRVETVKSLARGLDEHGVDGSSLIRFGLAQLFAAPVLGSVVASIFLEARGESLDDLGAYLDVEGWRRALGVSADGQSAIDDLDTVLGRASLMIEGWIASAPFDNLVALTPVGSQELSEWAAAIDPETRVAADVYRWLVERTLEPDLERWAPASLRHEYRYVTQGVAPHAPAVLLGAATPDPNVVAHALARHALDDEERRRESGWVEFMAAVQKQARMLLAQGRCAEAAALFEFLIVRYPSDPALRNNLAFCLITSRPSEAYESFLEAQRMGYEPKCLLLYNRASCATLEAQKREVLFEANRHWIEDLEPFPVPAFIWRQIGSGLSPTNTPDVRQDLAEAAVRIALDLGERDRVEVWRARLEALRHASAASTE